MARSLSIDPTYLYSALVFRTDGTPSHRVGPYSKLGMARNQGSRDVNNSWYRDRGYTYVAQKLTAVLEDGVAVLKWVDVA